MDYATIFDMPNWEAVGLSMLQASVLYLLVLCGLKLAGRRMFAELGAQEFVVLLLVADAANLGLTHNDGGFWSSVAAVITIITWGSVIDHIPVLRKLVEGKPRTLYANGRLDKKMMEKYRIQMDELDEAARCYGLASYKAFDRIILEGDGDLTGTVRQGRATRKVT